MPSHEHNIFHPDDWNQEPHQDNNRTEIWTTARYDPHSDMNNQCGTGYHVGWRRILDVVRSRNWGLRHRSAGNGYIDFRNSGPEDSKRLGVPFCCVVSSHLCCIRSHFIGHWHGINDVSTGFYHLHLTVMWRQSFRMHQIHQMATI
jgi:hypothetical protein